MDGRAIGSVLVGDAFVVLVSWLHRISLGGDAGIITFLVGAHATLKKVSTIELRLGIISDLDTHERLGAGPCNGRKRRSKARQGATGQNSEHSDLIILGALE